MTPLNDEISQKVSQTRCKIEKNQELSSRWKGRWKCIVLVITCLRGKFGTNLPSSLFFRMRKQQQEITNKQREVSK